MLQNREGLAEYEVLDCVRVATEREERGLVLTKAVQPSEAILLLPSSCLLNARTLEGLLPSELLPSKGRNSHPYHWKEEEQLEDGETEMKLPLTSVQALTLALALWKSKQMPALSQPHHLDKVLSSFPSGYPTFPIMWQVLMQSEQADQKTVDTCQRLLNALPTHVAHLCGNVSKRFARDCRSITAAEPHLAEAGSLAMSDLAWAWCSVNSRCVYIPLGLKPHQDNFTLAPLLDMANHTMEPDQECKVKWTPAGGLVLSAPAKTYKPRGFEAGQEIMIAYGPHSNGTLLSEYGFALPSPAVKSATSATTWGGNPFAEVNLDTIMETELHRQGQEASTQKKQLLQDHGYWLDYTIHPFPSPAHPSHRLAIALRLVVMDLHSNPEWTTDSSAKRMKTQEATSANIQRWEEMLMGQCEIVSPENEGAAIDLLQRMSEEVQQANEEKKRRLLGFHTSQGGLRGHSKGMWQENIDVVASSKMIASLLEEEIVIAQLMKQAILDGLTDW